MPDPTEYLEGFERAVRVFYHHQVYRTKTQTVEMLTPAPKQGVGEVGDELGELKGEVGRLRNYVGALESTTWKRPPPAGGGGGGGVVLKDGWMAKKNPRNSDTGAFSSSFNLDDAEDVSAPLPVPKRLQKTRGRKEMDKFRMTATAPGRRVTLETNAQEVEGSKVVTSSFFKPSVDEKGKSLFSQESMEDEVLNEPKEREGEKKKRGPLDIFRMSAGSDDGQKKKVRRSLGSKDWSGARDSSGAASN